MIEMRTLQIYNDIVGVQWWMVVCCKYPLSTDFKTSDVMLFPRMTKCLKYRISLHCDKVNTNSNHKWLKFKLHNTALTNESKTEHDENHTKLAKL